MRKAKLKESLLHATAELLMAQESVEHPENLEKLRHAELQVRMVLLSECPEIQPKAKGHHGG